ncbi:MAG: Asp-tRNA(Asn)/Glu-tRNA(Gln) amidotransferase subunit GatC [Candidatus Taylorbacteria bacterium]|nr:Asp-tRNA(Asn)/Glu-tRNA(Gln) amidotransferase subunit GatC [Candidatus Taylorbacteria bacterium]
MITKEEVEKLAELSKIRLKETEKESLRLDFEAILSYIAQINKVSPDPPEESGSLGVNLMRDDGRPHESGVFTEKLLSQAPSRERNFIKVKKIL